MAGLLEYLQTPGGMGLLSGVASYAANARRGHPVNSIGRGLIGGLTGYAQANDQIKQDEENAFQKRYRQMQMDEMQRKMEQAKAQQTWKAGLPQMMDKAQTKVTPFQPDDPFNQGPAAFGEVYGGDQHGQQTDALMANVQQGDPQALQDYLMRPESPYADKLIERQFLPQDPIKIGADDTLIDSRTYQPIVSGKGKQSGLAQLLAERAALQPGDPNLQAYDDAISKASTHQPAMKIENFPSPTPVMLPSGKPGLVQFGNKGEYKEAPYAPMEAQPKLAPGERFAADGQTIEAIPGSAQFIKQSGLHSKDYQTKITVELKTQEALKKIDAILDPKNSGAFNSNFGGYNAYATRLLPGATQDIATKIESLKSDMKMAGLELIRSGGSIGMMTEREWPIVQNMIDTIDPRMSEQAARAAFENIKGYMLRIQQNAEHVYESEWGNSQFAGKNQSVPATWSEAQTIQRMRSQGASDAQIAAELNKKTAKPAVQPSFDLPPNPKQYDNKTLTDTKTGKRFKSVNGKWQEVR